MGMALENQDLDTLYMNHNESCVREMKIIEQPGLIIFSGFNQRAIIAFCRVLKKYNVNFYIIALSLDDEIFLSEYSKHVVGVRKHKKLNLTDMLKEIDNVLKISSNSRHYILPSSEALNRFLLENRLDFEEKKCFISLVEKNLYYRLSDKYSFGELCKKFDISVPNEIEVPKRYPVVIKPKRYETTDGDVIAPLLIQEESEFVKFFNHHNRSDFYVQEYISGDSYYLMYYISKSHGSLSFSQQNLVQQGGGKSIIAASPADIHNQQIGLKFLELFSSLNFHGLIMVEVRNSKDEYVMIEANPRLWGPSQLFVDANVPFFEMYLKDLGFNIHIDDMKISNEVYYFWLGGFLNSMKEENITFHSIKEEDFLDDISKFSSNDIYLRRDTFHIALKELIKVGQ
ncbi:carbamoyl phosphate synthase-like protein [compost metagenome]